MDLSEFLDKPAGVIALIAVLFLPVLFLIIITARKRAAALQRFALLHGFEYIKSTQALKGEAFAQAPLFKHNPSGRFSNVLRGAAGSKQVLIFDFSYSSGAGDDESSRSQTVAVFYAARPPDFELAPRNFLHRLASVLGYKTIKFEDDPDFDRGFAVRGVDEPAIRAFFTEGRKARLKETSGWNAESAGGSLVVYRYDKLAGHDNMETFLEEASALARILIPAD